MPENIPDTTPPVKSAGRDIRFPPELIFDERISDTAFRVYGIIKNAAFDGRANISVKKIAERLGRGAGKRKRTKHAVIPAIAQLNKCGYILIDAVGRRHEYQIIGRPKTTYPSPEGGEIGRSVATHPSANGRLGVRNRSSGAPVDGRPAATLPSNVPSPLSNDDGARERENTEKERRANVASRLIGVFGFTATQAEKATEPERIDLAERWLQVGFDGAADARNPVACVVAAIRDGREPQKKPKTTASQYTDFTGFGASGKSAREWIRSKTA